MNHDFVNIFSKRSKDASGWNSAYWSIQRKVDVTDMGYLQFGPNWNDGIVFGFGSKELMRMTNHGYIGIGTNNPNSYLHVRNSKVNNTNVLRVDFTGGNVGSTSEQCALLRITSNSGFRPLISLNGKSIFTANGSLGIGTTKPKAKLDVHGTALLGYEYKINDFGSPLQSGFYYGYKDITGDIPDKQYNHKHLLTLRHGNQANNYQFQIGSNYAQNDRVFFRKIAYNKPESLNPGWHEFATRGKNTFSGNQNISGEVTCTKLNEISDIRFKKDIKAIKNPLTKILQLEGVTYKLDTENYPDKNFSEKKQVGMIAQDVEKVIPEIVHKNTFFILKNYIKTFTRKTDVFLALKNVNGDKLNGNIC